MQRIENHDLRIYKLNHKSARVEINRTEKNICVLGTLFMSSLIIRTENSHWVFRRHFNLADGETCNLSDRD